MATSNLLKVGGTSFINRQYFVYYFCVAFFGGQFTLA
uniref:Uncharacterized protein n=1 Tax=Anguilla anguilla TaxID=7936 RepID=A0A0E9TP73_ANGAN